jgi:hypothetical protein
MEIRGSVAWMIGAGLHARPVTITEIFDVYKKAPVV